MADLWNFQHFLLWGKTLNKKIHNKTASKYNELEENDYHVNSKRNFSTTCCNNDNNNKPLNNSFNVKKSQLKTNNNEPNESGKKEHKTTTITIVCKQNDEIIDIKKMEINEKSTVYNCIKDLVKLTHYPNSYLYGLIEYWDNYGAERILEDHEYIMSIKNEQIISGKCNRFVFVYTIIPNRNEYINKKKDYFTHPNLMPIEDFKSIRIQIRDAFYTGYSESRYPNSNPIFGSTVFVREFDKFPSFEAMENCNWERRNMLLRNKRLYFIDTYESLIEIYYETEGFFQKKLKEKPETFRFIADLTELNIYTINGNHRLESAALQRGEGRGGAVAILLNQLQGDKRIFLMFSCSPNAQPSEDEVFPNKLWLTALRLSKHGTILKQNYLRYLENKGNEKTSATKTTSTLMMTTTTSSATTTMTTATKTTIGSSSTNNKTEDEKKFEISDMSNSHVAMDFSQGMGRIVEDPQEAAEIARGEGRGSNRKKTRFPALVSTPADGLRFGPHLLQSYYHGLAIGRQKAETLVLQNGTNGAFLLRDSKNRPGCLVLTYLHEQKVHHQYIVPVILPQEDGNVIYLATCDRDSVFYDIHSLIEYYRLNKGSLHTVLTVSVKNPLQPNATPPRNKKSNIGIVLSSTTTITSSGSGGVNASTSIEQLHSNIQHSKKSNSEEAFPGPSSSSTSSSSAASWSKI